MDQLRFDGRVAVVTGGARGMGREHSLLLAQRGAKVVVADFGGELDGTGRSKGPADDVVKEIEADGGEGVACYADVSDAEEAASIIDVALGTFGRVDIVVNNAGISDPGGFADLSLDQFKKMVEVHYYGMLHVSKSAWPHMVAAGYGRFVNVTSESVFGMPKLTSYGSAKGACFALTRNMAADSSDTGIQVNGIMPRGSTRMANANAMSILMGVPEETLPPIMPGMPPEQVAPAVAYLAHESVPYNGEIFAVGSGTLERVVVLETKGITLSSERPTPEEIAENIATTFDIDDARLVGVGGVDTPGASPVVPAQ
jgi:NAD(P)-dependent dehydrogenase (short-subunit alcohol dehydrogenase family)